MTTADSNHHKPFAIRASLLDFEDRVVRFVEDGLLYIQGGRIMLRGESSTHLDQIPSKTPIHDLRPYWITPGWIDAHTHFPQTEMIASHGKQLLDWLHHYTFPTEQELRTPTIAERVSDRFFQEIFRHGTTSFCAFGAAGFESTEKFGAKAESLGVRALFGRSLSNRNVDGLTETEADSDLKLTEEQALRWNNRGRLSYALTPRFAPSCTEDYLKRIAVLFDRHPSLYVQSHLSENLAEISWVRTLFPESQNYFDVYNRAGLSGPKTIYAHAIHLSQQEWDQIQATKTRIVFCPSSNLFLGSGLFDLKEARNRGIEPLIGTDVGAGTHFSMLRTLGEAYKVGQLQGVSLDPIESLYRISLGASRALGWDHDIGTLDPGKSADLVLLNPELVIPRPPSRRYALQDILFGLFFAGDDRSILRTWVQGRIVHRLHSFEA